MKYETKQDRYLIHKNAEISVSKAELRSADQLHVSSDNVLDILDLTQHAQFVSNVNTLKFHNLPTFVIYTIK